MSQKRVRSPRHEAKVRFWQLPEDLAPCFALFYRIDLSIPDGGRVTDSLIPEWANMRFFSRGTPQLTLADGTVVEAANIATGPSSRAMQFDLDSASFWGFGLFPLGWARYVASPARDWADRAFALTEDPAFSAFLPLCKALDDARGNSAEAQFARIVDCLRAAAPMPADAQRVMRVHQVMTDPYLTEVSEFADAAGVSVRTLERICARSFGFAPRLILRRQRMMRSLTSFMLSKDKNWSESIDRHYHDQAHFVHEFHNFMGMTPTAYAQMQHPLLDAVMEERQRIWGAPALTSKMDPMQ